MATIQTYIPLYRQYRPDSFATVVGQQAIIQTLTNAIQNDKVAHAYLLCGPRGTGKTSTARIFAKSLNCVNGPTAEPCQVCESCTGINNGNALDVIEFDAASNNSVDDARELIENCQFAPMSGRYKIYIIDEVHMLSTAAFNALLKTLEEPPKNVIFIFATTEAHKVLPTIISRCQRFDFSRITRDDIIGRLKFIAGEEQFQIADNALTMIARHAKGGLRDAIGLLDQVSVLARIDNSQTVTPEDVARFIGALEEVVLLELSKSVADKNGNVLLEKLQSLEAKGIEANRLVKELTQHFRNLFLVKVSGEATTATQLELGEDYFVGLKQQTELFAMEELPQMLEKLASIERNLRGHSSGQLWLEVGLLEMAFREDINLVKDLAKRVEELETAIKSGVSVAPPPAQFQAPPQSQQQPAAFSQQAAQQYSQQSQQPVAAAPPVASPVVSMGGGKITWPQVIAQIASSTVRAMIKQQTFLISQDDSQVVIGCTSEPILALIKKPEKMIHVQKAVEAVVGGRIGVQIVLEKNQPKSTASPSPAPVASSPPPSIAPLPPQLSTAQSPPAQQPTAQPHEATTPKPVAHPMPRASFGPPPSSPPPATNPQVITEITPSPQATIADSVIPDEPETQSQPSGETSNSNALQSEQASGAVVTMPPPNNSTAEPVMPEAPPLEESAPFDNGVETPEPPMAATAQSPSLGSPSLESADLATPITPEAPVSVVVPQQSTPEPQQSEKPEPSVVVSQTPPEPIGDLNPEDLEEATKYTVQLLQGKIVE